jgi:hypothetical protein
MASISFILNEPEKECIKGKIIIINDTINNFSYNWYIVCNLPIGTKIIKCDYCKITNISSLNKAILLPFNFINLNLGDILDFDIEWSGKKPISFIFMVRKIFNNK